MRNEATNLRLASSCVRGEHHEHQRSLLEFSEVAGTKTSFYSGQE